jgi:hypothetical protein
VRGQTELPALGLALLVLTAVTVFGVVVADEAVRSADRSALERQAVVSLSDRLVGPGSPLTARANVLNESALGSLNESTLRSRFGVSNATDAKVTLEGNTLAVTGAVEGGQHIERLVVVETRERRSLTPAFTGRQSVTLPRRTDRADLRIHSPQNTTVPTVRVNERVVLHDESGLDGRYTVSLSRHRTADFRFDATGPLYQGNVTVTYYPVETRKARLGVTVDG